MNAHVLVTPIWSTASFGDTTAPSAFELSSLGAHLNRCRDATGRLFALQCIAERMDGFVASRLVTTLAMAALLIGISTLLG